MGVKRKTQFGINMNLKNSIAVFWEKKKQLREPGNSIEETSEEKEMVRCIYVFSNSKDPKNQVTNYNCCDIYKRIL